MLNEGRGEKSRRTRRKSMGLVALLALPLASGLGCAAAVVGVAAGAGAVAYTNRGAQGTVKGTVADVGRQAQAVFDQMGIQTIATGTKRSGAEEDLQGKAGAREIHIQIVGASPEVSRVEVQTREGALRWNKEYSRDILTRIVGATG